MDATTILLGPAQGIEVQGQQAPGRPSTADQVGEYPAQALATPLHEVAVELHAPCPLLQRGEVVPQLRDEDGAVHLGPGPDIQF